MRTFLPGTAELLLVLRADVAWLKAWAVCVPPALGVFCFSPCVAGVTSGPSPDTPSGPSCLSLVGSLLRWAPRGLTPAGTCSVCLVSAGLCLLLPRSPLCKCLGLVGDVSVAKAKGELPRGPSSPCSDPVGPPPRLSVALCPLPAPQVLPSCPCRLSYLLPAMKITVLALQIRKIRP